MTVSHAVASRHFVLLPSQLVPGQLRGNCFGGEKHIHFKASSPLGTRTLRIDCPAPAAPENLYQLRRRNRV